MKKIMGIDLGTKTIGVAFSDALRISAHPYKTYNVKTYDTSEALNIIFSLVDEFEIEEIAIGYPLHLSGQESTMSKRVKKFKEDILSNRPNLKVILIDERFSTNIALFSLKEMNINKQKQDKLVDALSASLILETYLGQLKNKERREVENE